MSLALWLRTANKKERTALAKRARTTVGQLQQLAGGHRMASAALAARIEKAVGDATHALPAVRRESLCPACDACEFAKLARSQ